MSQISSRILDIPKNHIALTSIEALQEIIMHKIRPHGITDFGYFWVLQNVF